MKPTTKMALRFSASLLAYIIFFLMPFCPWSDLLQELVTGSLATIVIVLMVGALIRRSGILARGFALVLLIPAIWYFSLLVYRLSPVGSDRSKVETEELLRASMSIFKFNGAQLETRRLLRRSSSLRYTGYALYLDGGSMGFVFSNQEAKVFVVFVPNPNLAEGIGLEDGRKFQRILLVANGEFAPDEPLELRTGSRAEAKVMRLVRSALQENLPAERRAEVLLLLEILAARTFDWETFQKRDFSSIAPSIRHTIVVRVPTKLYVHRTEDSLAIAFTSFQAINLTVSSNLVTGIECESRVYRHGEPPPPQSNLGWMGGTDMESHLDSYNYVFTRSHNNIPLPGERYIVEYRLTIFESDMPTQPQHLWSPHGGEQYKVLWTHMFKEITD